MNYFGFKSLNFILLKPSYGSHIKPLKRIIWLFKSSQKENYYWKNYNFIINICLIKLLKYFVSISGWTMFIWPIARSLAKNGKCLSYEQKSYLSGKPSIIKQKLSLFKLFLCTETPTDTT